MFLKNKKRTGIYVGLVLILLIFFHYVGAIIWLENGLIYILTPATTKIHKTTNLIKDGFLLIFIQEEIVDGYSSCLTSAESINVLDSKIKLLEEENLELKKMLEFKNGNEKIISAEVIGEGVDNVEQTLIINKGENDKIQTGYPVVSEAGILIGKIGKIGKNTSFVRLINDSQSKIAATIINDDKSLGVVEGGFGISLRMKFIPRDETVLIGDKIITSGLELEMPRGLLIGEVVAVENEAYQPFQQAVLKPTADLSRINIVSIIIQQDDNN